MSARVENNTIKIARKIIPFMSKKRIQLSPDNDRLWFEYFRGSMVEFKTRLDELLALGDSLSDETLDEVFNKFLARDLHEEDIQKVEKEAKAVGKANEESRKLLEPLVINLDDLSNSNSNYGKKFEVIANKMNDGVDSDRVETIITTLVKETSSISQENKKISQDLQKSSNQLEELRIKLEAAKQEARIDTLTKLLNRRAFDEAMQVEWNYIKNSGDNTCLAMIDIDHFKIINDTYGHPVGDKALRALARLITTDVGANDMVYRYGGEEFAVIMRNITLQKAEATLDKLRQDIADHEFAVRNSVLQITISIGVACFTSTRSKEESILAADEALYLAKYNGRNQIASELKLNKSNA